MNREKPKMNDTERKLVRWLHNHTNHEAASAIAYELLLGDETGRSPQHPYNSQQFSQCLELIRQVPEARETVSGLAAKSRYWAALERHWETLRDMLNQETDGSMVHPAGDRTTSTLRDLIGKVSSGHDLPDVVTLHYD